MTLLTEIVFEPAIVIMIISLRLVNFTLVRTSSINYR